MYGEKNNLPLFRSRIGFPYTDKSFNIVTNTYTYTYTYFTPRRKY